MKSFSPKVEHLFKASGWYEGRNVVDQYLGISHYLQCPSFLIDFLKEYGNLTVETVPIGPQKSKSQLIILPEYFEELVEDYLEDSSPMPETIFPFAILSPDYYAIGCDSSGRVYMMGDAYIFRGQPFENGIENILLESWEDSMEWDGARQIWTRDYKL